MKGDVGSLYFTYEVVWEPSDIRWASRWDVFLKSQGEQIHWFSIVNSIVIVMFLTSKSFSKVVLSLHGVLLIALSPHVIPIDCVLMATQTHPTYFIRGTFPVFTLLN